MEDREMSLAEHIEELRVRVLRATVAVLAAMAIAFTLSGRLISYFWRSILKYPPYVFSPLEWIVLQLNVSLLIALVACYPYIAYELYMFARPGLYEHERRFLKTILIPSYLIFVLGVLFSMLFVVPLIYGVALSQGYDPYLSAAKTIDSAVKLGMSFGIFSQIPLLMFLATRFGVVDYKTLKNARILFYAAAIAIVTNFSGDLSFFAQIAALVMLIVMYEVGLVLLGIARRINKLAPATA